MNNFFKLNVNKPEEIGSCCMAKVKTWHRGRWHIIPSNLRKMDNA